MGGLAQSLVWSILIVGALAGWGALAAVVCRRAAGLELGVFEVFGSGVVVFIALTGLFVALGLASSHFFDLFVVTGLMLALWRLAQEFRGSSLADHEHRVIPLSIGALSFVVIWLFSLFSVFTQRYLNACDDPWYYYLTKRLLLYGNLNEPFSLRRATSLGGMTGVQALFMAHLNSYALNYADVLLGMMLLSLGLCITRAGRISGAGLVLSVVLLVAFPVVATNTSPVVLPVALMLLALRLALRLRTEAGSRAQLPALGVILGSVLGALATLRPQFLPPTALVILIVVLWPPSGWTAVRRVASVAVGAFAVLAPWMLASWIAIRTPLFMLLPGNLNPRWPAAGTPAPGESITGIVKRSYDALSVRPWAPFGLFVIVVAWLLLRRYEEDAVRRRWATAIMISAGVGAILLVIYLRTSLWPINTNLAGLVTRYWAPAGLAAVLFPTTVFLIFRIRSRLPLTFVAVITAVLVLLLGPIDLNQLWGDLHYDQWYLTTGRLGSALEGEPYNASQAQSRSLIEQIPGGSKVLVATDEPSDFLGHHFSVSTLDFPGAASPDAGSLPYFEGANAKVTWLRAQGYDAVVLIDPAQSGCLYSSSSATRSIRRHTFAATWSTFILDWGQLYAEVASVPGVTTVHSGPLELVLLRPPRG